MWPDKRAMARRLREPAAWADAVLICVGLFFFLLLVHLLLTYNFFSSPRVPRYYYVIATLGTLLPLLSLRLPQPAKVKLTLTLVSTAFTLYLSELGLYLLTPASGLEAARESGVAVDARPRLEVVEDFRARGVDAYPSVHAGLELKDDAMLPLSGVSGKTTVQCNEGGTYAIYESDEHGFNNPPGTWSRHPEYVLLGDSFAHGFCVSPPDDLRGQLQRLGLESLNLGLAGSGPLSELAVFREYVEPVKPHTILWVYFEGNDLDDLTAEKKQPRLMHYYLDEGFSQDLIHRHGEIDGALIGYVADRERDERLRLGKVPGAAGFYQRIALGELGKGIRLYRLRDRLGRALKYDRPDFAMLAGVLQRVKDVSSSWGGRVYFVYLPDYGRYASGANPDAYYHRREVLSLVKGLNIPLIDVHPAFVSHEDPLSLFPFRNSIHYGPEGYQLVAQTIASHLYGAGVAGRALNDGQAAGVEVR